MKSDTPDLIKNRVAPECYRRACKNRKVERQLLLARLVVWIIVIATLWLIMREAAHPFGHYEPRMGLR